MGVDAAGDLPGGTRRARSRGAACECSQLRQPATQRGRQPVSTEGSRQGESARSPLIAPVFTPLLVTGIC